MITETTQKYLKGYELRAGSTVRNLADAPVKTYCRDKIAVIGQCGRRLRARTAPEKHSESTLKRMSALDLIVEGV